MENTYRQTYISPYSIYPSTYPPTYSSTYPSTYPPTYSSTYPSTYPPTYSSTYSSTYPPNNIYYQSKSSNVTGCIFWGVLILLLIIGIIFLIWYWGFRDDGRPIGSTCGQNDQCQKDLRCVDAICQPVVQ